MCTLALVLDLNLRNCTASSRLSLLKPYIGEQVTLTTRSGEWTGELTATSAMHAVVDDRYRLGLNDLLVARVHVGGDWATAGGHKSGSRTARIVLRCHEDVKRTLEHKAASAGQTLTAFILAATGAAKPRR